MEQVFSPRAHPASLRGPAKGGSLYTDMRLAEVKRQPPWALDQRIRSTGGKGKLAALDLQVSRRWGNVRHYIQHGGYNQGPPGGWIQPSGCCVEMGTPTGRYKPPNPQNHETEYAHHSNSQLPLVFPRSLDRPELGDGLEGKWCPEVVLWGPLGQVLCPLTCP